MGLRWPIYVWLHQSVAGQARPIIRGLSGLGGFALWVYLIPAMIYSLNISTNLSEVCLYQTLITSPPNATKMVCLPLP